MDLREIGAAAQRRHPWEVARARFFAELVRERAGQSRPLRVLDVGAGDGYLAGVLLSHLAPGSSCLCVDAHYTDAHLRELAAEGAQGVAFARAAPAGSFDVLLMLDVLEHVVDDAGLLKSYADRLSHRSHLVVSVPAFMALYGKHDLFLGHHRRYRLAELRSLVATCGFEVGASGSLFHGLLPLRALQTAGERLRGGRAHPGGSGFAEGDAGGGDLGAWRAGPRVTGLVRRALSADNALSRVASRLGVPLPGLSAWVWAERA
jgi:SAM-dependent methyltransferase